MQKLNIQKLLDAPCGDYHWFKLIAIPNEIEYIGGDIVKKIIESNTQQFGRSNTRFIHLDIINDKLPDADMWLCRDTLFHFSNADIEKVLQNLKRSNIKFLLTTTFPDTELNQDIKTGDYRPINLEKSPFNLSKALQIIDDSDAGHFGKKLALWKI